MSKFGLAQILFLCVMLQARGQSPEQPREAGDTCFDGPFDNVGIEGCLGQCEDFDTLEEAQSSCLTAPDCSGVTLAAYGDNEAINAGIGLYELRQGPGLIKSHGDKTWIKQAWCKDALANEASMNSNLNHRLDYIEPNRNE